MKIAVLGSGYVGLVTAALFADLGNQVIGVDIDRVRVERLCRGESPIYEPGLDELLTRNLAAGRLRFTTDTADAVATCEIIFIAVGTPPAADGSTDLSQVDSAALAIAQAATGGSRLVVNKSTVPVGTGARVQAILAQHALPGATFTVLSNPEFLREGTAIKDAFAPDRIVIGAPSAEIAAPLVELYQSLQCPVLLTDVTSAELIKYASNAFLATKLSFINALADLCETVGGDIRQVAQGIGMDPRINPFFLQAGIGYGGSCLPKDVDSLRTFSQAVGSSNVLLEAVREVNQLRVPHLLIRMDAALDGLAGKTVAVLGLTFKAHTDDLRESRALVLCQALLEAGATVRAHDPIATDAAARVVPEVGYHTDVLEAVHEADAVVIATEWPEYAEMDLAALRLRMRGDLLVDGRNVHEATRVEAAGLRYLGIGRAFAPMTVA